VVRRGEAVAEVTASGAVTKFGRIEKLVRTAVSKASAEGGAARRLQSHRVHRVSFPDE
jgi:hypothetical protein